MLVIDIKLNKLDKDISHTAHMIIHTIVRFTCIILLTFMVYCIELCFHSSYNTQYEITRSCIGNIYVHCLFIIPCQKIHNLVHVKESIFLIYSILLFFIYSWEPQENISLDRIRYDWLIDTNILPFFQDSYHWKLRYFNFEKDTQPCHSVNQKRNSLYWVINFL